MKHSLDVQLTRDEENSRIATTRIQWKVPEMAPSAGAMPLRLVSRRWWLSLCKIRPGSCQPLQAHRLPPSHHKVAPEPAKTDFGD
jgi:hypothetical protein